MAYALITGASGGLGKALAIELAKRGTDLLLVSRNSEKLDLLSKQLSSTYKVKCPFLALDLSEKQAPFEVKDFISAYHIKVNILINNACNYVRGPFIETDENQELETIMLQCTNLMLITKLLLPNLLTTHLSKILNIGSTGSFVPGPFNSVYCAAKAFVFSFSVALSEELKSSGIAVSTLCPGGMETNFQKGLPEHKSVLFKQMTPQKVAEIAVNQMYNEKQIIIPGFWNKCQVILMKFLPIKIITSLSAKLTLKSGLSKKNLVINH